MIAGRELDALVAEKVMAWDVSKDQLWQKVYEQPDDLVETSKDKQLRRTLQPYSTDISAAWEVVEKLRLAVVPQPNGWCASKLPEDGENTAVGVMGCTAPLAICLAALKAVGAEI